MKNGQRVDEMRGANASRLEQLIKKHMADEKPEESDLKLPLGHVASPCFLPSYSAE